MRVVKDELRLAREQLQAVKGDLHVKVTKLDRVRQEACTQWASDWLAFQRRASRAFPDLEFNTQLSDEEVEESVFEAEADAGVISAQKVIF